MPQSVSRQGKKNLSVPNDQESVSNQYIIKMFLFKQFLKGYSLWIFLARFPDGNKDQIVKMFNQTFFFF